VFEASLNYIARVWGRRGVKNSSFFRLEFESQVYPTVKRGYEQYPLE
jgi:hypothetical protein